MCEIIILLLLWLLIMSISVIIILIFKIKRIKYNISVGIEVLEDKDVSFTQEILIQDKNLEKLIMKMNQNIRKKNRYIKELSKEVADKKKVLTSISHDLRTPLTSLIGYLEILNLDRLDKEEIKEYIEIAYHKSLDLKKYTDNMFDWFKLSNSSMKANLDIYDVNELMRKLIIDWIPIVSKNNIEFNINISKYPFYIQIDESFFSRIINNIINNAIVHSKCSVIYISIKCINSIVVIKIRDNGIGIKDKHIQHIFEWLYTDDFTRTKGTGIGLNIVKMLIELLDGEIKVESKYNEGTTFILTFGEYKKS